MNLIDYLKNLNDIIKAMQLKRIPENEIEEVIKSMIGIMYLYLFLGKNT